jgi:creatinine amidohydrolase
VHEFEALTALQLEALVRDGATTAIVPFGSIEHQGDHLPLGADALLADAVGREVALRLGALLLPTVRVGDASHHRLFFGTLTLQPGTLSELAYELGDSLARAGVRVVALVSTHGGNALALKAAAERLNDALPDLRVCAPRGDVGLDPGKHAGAWLTAVMLKLHPEHVRQADAEGATPERGAEHFERFVGSIVAEVRGFASEGSAPAA